jgi:hypothetical protein
MDREPLGWSVTRHVVDVTFRELELPRPGYLHRYLGVGEAAPMEVTDADFEPDPRPDFAERRQRSSVPAGGPSPAP